MIKEAVMTGMKDSMKRKDMATTSVLRLIIAKFNEVEIQLRPKNKEVTPEDEIAALRSMVKSRKDSVLMYKQGGRDDLASKEEYEIQVIEGFLPARMSDEDVKNAVNLAISETKATNAKQMGMVIGNLKKKYGSELDMSQVTPIIKEILT